MYRYDLNDFLLVQSVAAQRNLTEGAKQLGLSAPSASARTNKLEDALGIRIFLRNRNGTFLTEGGKFILSTSQKIFSQLDTMERELLPYKLHEKGVVRIFANYGAAIDFLPNDIAQFFCRHRQFRVFLEQRSSREVVEGVAKGQADLGISAWVGDYEGVDFYPYRKDKLVLAVPQSHALARQSIVFFEEALEYDFVSLTDASAMQRFIFQQAEKAGRPIEPKVQVESQSILISLVKSGAGIAVVSRHAADNSLCTGLKVIALADDWANRNLRIAVSADQEKRSEMAEFFKDFLLSERKSHSQDGEPSFD